MSQHDGELRRRLSTGPQHWDRSRYPLPPFLLLFFFKLNFEFDRICNKLMSMSSFPPLHLQGSWVVAASRAYPDNSRGLWPSPGERGGVVMIKGLETDLWFDETKIIFKAAGLKSMSGKVSNWGSLWWSGIRQVLMVMTAIIALPRGHQHPCWEVSPTQDFRFRKLIWGRSSPSWLFLVYQVGGKSSWWWWWTKAWISFLSVSALPSRTSTAFPCLTDPAPNTETEKKGILRLVVSLQKKLRN